MSGETTEGLLRKTAVAHKLLGPQSAPVIAIENHFRLQLVFWVLLLFVATYLLTKTSYKETVAARGVLEPRLGSQKIVSPAVARVEAIHVSQGDRVMKGDVLASLTTDVYNAQGVSVHRQSLGQLHADRRLLEEQLRTEKSARMQARRWSKRAAENVGNSRMTLDREAEILAIQLGLSERSLEAVTKLRAAGNSSAAEFDKQYSVHLNLLSREQALSQRKLQLAHELDALHNSQENAELEFKQSILRLRRELQSIEQRIDALDNQTLFTVIAEGPGVVAEIGMEAGKPVFMNQALFYINPVSPELEATIYVSAAVQGKLTVGQSVMLRYDAFDYRLYGRGEATVTAIGQASLNPKDTVLPIEGLSEHVFKVTAQLQSDSVQGEAHYSLKTGSTLIADFVVSDMSLLQFIFKPILGLQGKVT